MKKIWLTTAFVLGFTGSAFAGGLLTNTNQNVYFLRMLSRDATIGIDGVYSNPAGVMFLNQGFHLSVNWQNAHQTRTIDTAYGNLFANHATNPTTAATNYARTFKGKADAPIVPSLQAAYNKGDWSFQFNFAVVGGGGKCTFENGLGSFEGVVASLNAQLASKGAAGLGYNYDSYMRGRQYYYGFTVGAAHKLNEHLSIYGGLRLLYGSANYYGYVKNIQMMTADGMKNAPTYYAEQRDLYNTKAGEYAAKAQEYAAIAQQMAAAGMADKAAQAQAAADQYSAGATQYAAGAQSMAQVAAGTEDIELNCDQTGFGIAPIIGLDYKTGKFNFAAKYEFKTRMRLKNKSANSASAANIEMLDKFADGNKVPEDSPALLTVGAQYEILPQLRLAVGYHHFFDVDTKQYYKSTLGDTNEYNAGVEYDVNKYLQVSAGVQRTAYDMEPGFMNDISFNVSSYTYGFGVGIQLHHNMKLNLAYFQTLYDDYNTSVNNGSFDVTNKYTRTNRVFGVGLDMSF